MVRFYFTLRNGVSHCSVLTRRLALLEWDESRSGRGANTGAAVSRGLVVHREFTGVGSDHFRSDFDTAEHLAVVDADDVAHHVRQDGHVSTLKKRQLE